jgi:hypothetical protein
VKSFNYLGHKITEDGRSDKEIKWRIGIAKTAFSKNEYDFNQDTNFHEDKNKNLTLFHLVDIALWSRNMHHFKALEGTPEGRKLATTKISCMSGTWPLDEQIPGNIALRVCYEDTSCSHSEP